MPFAPITDKEYEAGLALGRERLARAVRARRVGYDAATDSLLVSLPTGEVAIPRAEIAEFADVPAEEMALVRLSAIGDAIAVGSADIHVDLAGLLADLEEGRAGLGRDREPALAQ